MSSWLDEMPSVPLERGVPVTIPEGGFRGVVVLEDGPRVEVAWDGAHCRQEAELWRLRVDLDHPQGVAYALRLLWDLEHDVFWFDEAVSRWLRDETTDADRLAIARALREVAHG